MSDGINIFKVVALATDLHSGQYRKHAIEGYQLPYVFHAFDVSKRIWRWGISNPIIQYAAMLHDTIEDTLDEEHADDARLRIEALAGIDVLNLVEELTCYGDKIEYMSSFKDKSLDAVIIKVADRLCNVEDFIQSSPDYAEKYFNKAKNVFDTFLLRGEDIISTFSESIYINISADITSVYGLVLTEKE